jgi:hypothetical protein
MTTFQKFKTEFEKLTSQIPLVNPLKLKSKMKIDNSKVSFYLDIVRKLNRKYGKELVAPLYIMATGGESFVMYKKNSIRK